MSVERFGVLQQISENLYWAPEGVLILCACQGGLDSPFHGEEKFFGKLLAKFPNSARLLVKRYVELGWMRERTTVRMKGFKRSPEEIEAMRAEVTVFLAKEEEQYIALGYAPISFDGYSSEAIDEYKAKLLERAGVSA